MAGRTGRTWSGRLPGLDGTLRLLSLAMVALSLSAMPAAAQRGGKISCDINPGNVDCVGRQNQTEAKPPPAGGQTPSTEKAEPPKSK